MTIPHRASVLLPIFDIFDYTLKNVSRCNYKNDSLPSHKHDENLDDTNTSNERSEANSIKDFRKETSKTNTHGNTFEQINDLNTIGRRVVDMDFILKQILSYQRHKPFECCTIDMVLIKETRKGLKSTFTLQCKICGLVDSIGTSSETSDLMNINEATILGAISTGIGYAQCQEFLNVLQVPFMRQETFKKAFCKVADVIHETASSSMEKAAEEEKQLAKEAGDIDEDGVPYITVIADGAWSKRSYGLNYDAASGVACIIGQRTSKLLYLGVRNKYCTICTMADRKGETTPQHVCSRNWTGTSTAMESDIIVKGFRCSIAMYGLKYLKLVGDGDSSVHRKFLAIKPYGSKLVQKIECRNHLLRNFCKKINELCGK
ncbi:uncharacterized protein [Onthophagus taurus]|uniref:uncharacterized protein n=1 Tax=Onthophagus taurus TaxID=166361 RepID=UPI0039BE68E5